MADVVRGSGEHAVAVLERILFYILSGTGPREAADFCFNEITDCCQ